MTRSVKKYAIEFHPNLKINPANHKIKTIKKNKESVQ